MADSDPVASFLREQGAEQLPHARGQSLYRHLLGTREILSRWDQDAWVCQAGALHSIYATQVYQRALVPLERRQEVMALVGPEAERLVYLFGAILREDFFGQLETHIPVPEEGLHVRRHADSGRESISLREIQPLLVLLLANEAEHEPGAEPRHRARLDALIAHLQRGDAIRGRGRFDRYIDQLAHNHQAPLMGTYPDLPAQPFYDPARVPLVPVLEDAYADIRREVLALDPARFHREAEAIGRSGAWDVFLLNGQKRKHTTLPTVVKLIESGAVQTLAGLCYVSKLAPGAHIAPHRGPTNTRLRCHLGIQIPQGDCGIRVGNEVRRWQEGKCLLLDDSHEHEAWNRTPEDRLVLIVDLWHPDLTDGEIALLEGLRRHINAEARSLARYWAANAQARATQGSVTPGEGP